MSLASDLGDVEIVNAHWRYDHELDPFNPTKVCVLLCSDHVFVRAVAVRRAVSGRRREEGEGEEQESK